jgi:eukaryotic-like serine/threonine-protein kinase
MTATPQLASRSSAVDAPCRDASIPLGRLGNWELVSLLGEGRFCRVFRARPIGSGDTAANYAVKVLVESWANDPRGLELLSREAQVGRRVSHSHLLPILASSLREAPYFLVMPCLEGETLARRLARGRLATPQALWIARQIGEALGALEDAGWMHGDLKPANVMLSPTGHVTLFDLGFARSVQESGSVADRPLVGTLHYAAPEIITSALATDARSDFYSLGVMLFEMLAGRLPFDSHDGLEVARLHREGIATDIRTLVPDLPPTVSQLVRTLLAKDPLRRPHSSQELVNRLVTLEIGSLDEWSLPS